MLLAFIYYWKSTVGYHEFLESCYEFPFITENLEWASSYQEKLLMTYICCWRADVDFHLFLESFCSLLSIDKKALVGTNLSLERRYDSLKKCSCLSAIPENLN